MGQGGLHHLQVLPTGAGHVRGHARDGSDRHGRRHRPRGNTKSPASEILSAGPSAGQHAARFHLRRPADHPSRIRTVRGAQPELALDPRTPPGCRSEAASTPLLAYYPLQSHHRLAATRSRHDHRTRDHMARDNGHRCPTRHRRQTSSSSRSTLDLPPLHQCGMVPWSRAQRRPIHLAPPDFDHHETVNTDDRRRGGRHHHRDSLAHADGLPLRRRRASFTSSMGREQARRQAARSSTVNLRDGGARRARARRVCRLPPARARPTRPCAARRQTWDQESRAAHVIKRRTRLDPQRHRQRMLLARTLPQGGHGQHPPEHGHVQGHRPHAAPSRRHRRHARGGQNLPWQTHQSAHTQRAHRALAQRHALLGRSILGGLQGGHDLSRRALRRTTSYGEQPLGVAPLLSTRQAVPVGHLTHRLDEPIGARPRRLARRDDALAQGGDDPLTGQQQSRRHAASGSDDRRATSPTPHRIRYATPPRHSRGRHPREHSERQDRVLPPLQNGQRVAPGAQR